MTEPAAVPRPRNITIRNLVFDLDGTLLDTVPDSCAALNRVFAEDGLRRLSLDEVRTTVGEGARVMLARALTMVGGPSDGAALDRYVRRYLDAYLADPTGHTVVYPGIHDTLSRLRRDGLVMGVCTNKPRASATAVLARIFPDRPFAAVVCPEDVPKRKPDGAHVLATIAAMGGRPEESVMIGDSETDIAAAAGAGVASIAVAYGYSHVLVDDLPANAVIRHFADLPQALARLGMEGAG